MPLKEAERVHLAQSLAANVESALALSEPVTPERLLQAATAAAALVLRIPEDESMDGA